jgi:hypothetical protein
MPPWNTSFCLYMANRYPLPLGRYISSFSPPTVPEATGRAVSERPGKSILEMPATECLEDNSSSVSTGPSVQTCSDDTRKTLSSYAGRQQLRGLFYVCGLGNYINLHPFLGLSRVFMRLKAYRRGLNYSTIHMQQGTCGNPQWEST